MLHNFYKTQELMKEIERLEFESLFETRKLEDADLFRLDYNHQGMNMNMVIVVNERNSVLVRYMITANNNPDKKDAILKFLNTLNEERKLKYYMDEDGDIFAEWHYFATDEKFDAELLIESSISFLKGIERDYPDLMRIIWS